MINSLAPNLMVTDVNKSVDFYTNILGFEFIMGVPVGTQNIVTSFLLEEELAHAMVKYNTVEFMFHKTFAEEFTEFQGKVPAASLSLYMMVDDVDKYYNQIKSKATVYHDLKNQWYGNREFYIKDCDGYILGFAQKVQNI